MNILIIDDNADSVRLLLEILAKRAIRGTVATNKAKVTDYIEQGIWNMAIINHDFADGFENITGRQILNRLKTQHPEMPTVMLTESDSAKTACKAIQIGYTRIIVKPILPQQIEEILDTFLPNHQTQTVAWSKQGCSYPYRIIGASPALARTVQLAKKVAPTLAPVLITGQSGTGKELIAQLIHTESQRSQGPFIKVNCAALNDSLLESELFGHEKGAFTGAGSRHKGRFERAHGGTLLLDEITETRPQFQAKLLRVLEQMNFERVGGSENIDVNVRIISTTNTDIIDEVENKRFRTDLYYRLAAIKLTVDPLRKRPEDIIPLIWLFINQFAHEAARPITSIDKTTLNIFETYHWPGNVRQLRNVIRTALILGSGQTLTLADVPWLIEELQPKRTTDTIDTSQLAGRPLQELEQRAILATLEETKGNQTKAAKVLGISDRTLRDKVKRYRNQNQLASTR